MSRVISKVRVIRSEESRMESLVDPSKWGDLDERDPKSMAKMMKRLGKEFGEELGEDADRVVDEAMDEEMISRSNEESED
jgi:hypothetical protein